MVRRYLGGSKAKSWVTGSSPVSDHQLEKRKNYIFPAADELHNQLFDKLAELCQPKYVQRSF